MDLYWNWAVALYLFVAGLSAGAYFVSALAFFLDERKYAGIIRNGAMIAPFPLLAGILCLIYDLERPQLFWQLLFSWQPASVMFLGTWILVAFSMVSLLHFYAWAPPILDLSAVAHHWRTSPKQPKILRWLASGRWPRLLRQERFFQKRALLAALGIPLAVGTGIYTGILLGVVNSRPLWNSPILPLLFLLSACKSGTAAVRLFGGLKSFRRGSAEELRAGHRLIRSIDFVLIPFYLIALFLYLFGLYSSPGNSAQAAHLLTGGEFALPFWLLVVGLGIFFPLLHEGYEFFGHEKRREEARGFGMAGIAAVFVLIGGFMLRYVVIYAGQISQALS